MRYNTSYWFNDFFQALTCVWVMNTNFFLKFFPFLFIEHNGTKCFIVCERRIVQSAEWLYLPLTFQLRKVKMFREKSMHRTRIVSYWSEIHHLLEKIARIDSGQVYS